jgi:membrane protease YdiL (CAAX protease family)
MEWLLLFVIFPVAVRRGWLGMNREIFFAPGILYAFIVYYTSRESWTLPGKDYPRGRLVVRMILTGLAILAVARWLNPGSFLVLPREHTLSWLVMMVLYPPVSAWPQEFVYRRFYFWRYESLFGSGRLLTISSTVVFSFMHLIYANRLALILTLAGGWMFATLYQRTHKLIYPWIEHSFYGQVLLTAGMQSFFLMSNQ